MNLRVKNLELKTEAKHSGFTLVEVLMVMLILAFVMMAASGLASTVINSAGKNKHRVEAIYLTQQCTELLRNLRDSMWRQNMDMVCPFVLPGESEPIIPGPGDTRVFGITASEHPAGPLGISPDCQQDFGVEIEMFAQAEDAQLYYHPTGLRHTISTEESPYRRYFVIDDYTEDASDPNLKSIEIKCHTEWDQGKAEISQILTNWRQP